MGLRSADAWQLGSVTPLNAEPSGSVLNYAVVRG
jgi:hypothetical protein